MIHTHYLFDVLSNTHRKAAVNRLVKQIRDSGLEFQSIVFAGFSGSLIAPLVADRLDKSLVLVRKESSHSGLFVEGDVGDHNFIIIDDFVCSGATLDRIFDQLAYCEQAKQMKCVGMFFYGENSSLQLEQLSMARNCPVYWHGSHT